MSFPKVSFGFVLPDIGFTNMLLVVDLSRYRFPKVSFGFALPELSGEISLLLSMRNS
jgi:hypothetical protein